MGEKYVHIAKVRSRWGFALLSAFGWAGLAAGGRLDMVSRASRASRVGRIRWAPRRAAVRGCDRTLRSASCVMCQRCLNGASGCVEDDAADRGSRLVRAARV